MKKISIILGSVLLFSCSEKKSEVQPIETSSVNSPSQKIKKKGNENLEGYRLISQSDCTSCHKGNAKLIGPSYQQIADKYNSQDTEKLAEIIINGGTGVWGQIPMSAHPNLSQSEAQKMVEYILSFK